MEKNFRRDFQDAGALLPTLVQLWKRRNVPDSQIAAHASPDPFAEVCTSAIIEYIHTIQYKQIDSYLNSVCVVYVVL